MADVKFPKMHIAESVVNRILNFRDELASGKAAALPKMETAPSVPDPSVEGAQLELDLQSPTEPSAAPAGMGIDPMASLLTGEDLIGGLDAQ